MAPAAGRPLVEEENGMTAVEGIVERSATGPGSFGRLGMHLLLTGSNVIYAALELSEVYGDVHGHPLASGSLLATLISPGDHVSFEVDKLYGRIVPKSFRNWTLEHRLFGIEKDISQGLPEPRALGTGRGRLEG